MTHSRTRAAMATGPRFIAGVGSGLAGAVSVAAGVVLHRAERTAGGRRSAHQGSALAQHRQRQPVGRISAIDALENDFAHVIVGTASGGVFKSINAGTTWTPIFDNYGSASIGDVAIFQKNPDIIWVGTGEECGRNSAAWGDGIYKSTDGGKTFTNMGLKDTYNIGTVVAASDRSRTSSTWRRSAASGAAAAIAASSRRSTAARPGRS